MKIICVARNYAEHAREMNHTLPEEPVFFIKPDTALLPSNTPFIIPGFSNEIHYETEIVLKISKDGKNIPEKDAMGLISEVTVGIDFTARDIQNECKKKGWPWEKAKGFDGSALAGKFLSCEGFTSLNDVQFHLNINGNTVQEGNTMDMIFSIEKLISHVSVFITLKKGDLFFTGTPAGVGKVNSGDCMEGFINDLKLFDCKIK